MANGTIFDKFIDISIDCDPLKTDLTELSQSRYLSQFNNSCTFNQLICAIAEWQQGTLNATVDMICLRSLNDAQGEQQDIIGRIVGQDRVLLNAGTKEYYGVDSISEGVGRTDASPSFVEGAPLLGNLPASDFDYLRLIKAKIFKNHVKAGSIPELIQFGKLITGKDISIQRVAPMDLNLIVRTGTTINDVALLTSFIDDKEAEKKYLMPLPTTARFVGVEFRPENVYMTDRSERGADQGRAGGIITDIDDINSITP